MFLSQISLNDIGNYDNFSVVPSIINKNVTKLAGPLQRIWLGEEHYAALNIYYNKCRYAECHDISLGSLRVGGA